MKVYKGDTVDYVYGQLVLDLLAAEQVGNTNEINNCCIIVDRPTTKNIFFPRREISEKYSVAELEWYWSGDNSCHTIGQYAKMWLRLSDDGLTNNSAYGYILQKKYRFNQIEQVIDILQNDRNSRRAILNISDPNLDKKNTKDLQCTIGLQFLIRNNLLETTVYMRSNDVYFGFPYDYIYFVSIAEYIAKRLNIKVGTYTHHATSMHMYEKDFAKFLSTPYYTNVINIDVMEIIERTYNHEKMERASI